MIYAGQGVHYAQAWDELKRAGRAARGAGDHEPRGQERLPGEPPAVAGLRRPRHARAGLRSTSTDADVVFGDRLQLRDAPASASSSRAGQDASSTPPSTRTTSTRTSRASYAMVGDAKLDAAALLTRRCSERLGGKPRGRTEAVVAADRARRTSSGCSSGCPSSPRTTTPLSPYRVIWDLHAHRRRAEHHHHARRRQPARPALAVLEVDDAAELHRLGQDHAARLRPRPGDGRQARAARQALHQRAGATRPSA